MSDQKVFTVAEVAKYTDRNECYIIIEDKVYNASKFIDEHPGGIEVLIDVGGQDATEAFDDVGHSTEAREILKTIMVGTVKKEERAAAPSTRMTDKEFAHGVTPWQGTSQGPLGIGSYAFIGIGIASAYFSYQYIMQSLGKA